MRSAGVGVRGLVSAGVLAASAGLATGGGSPESVLIIADPLNAESMYAANYYRFARGIPASNVLYFHPGASDYQSFVDFNLAALRALVAERGIEGQADYVVLMPGCPFYVDAPGLVSDQCSPVNRFSITGAYTTAFVADEVLAGVNSAFRNEYSVGNFNAARFDSERAWLGGSGSQDPDAKRYYLGAMLGYTGERGNTLEEILMNVDRSVGADFGRPTETFYFCQTTDQPRSGPRHGTYPGVVSRLASLGAVGSHEFRELPRTEHDILSIFTGAHTLNIAGANMTILPGAYCDHLTSFAAMFDNSNQTKISEWIRKGATASWGTVEEPCNYAGKFTSARSMAYYFEGSSVGEAVFRSVRYTPFQGLLYGDPLCRPFDIPPVVTVPDAPTEPVAGTITLTPEGTSGKDFTFVLKFDAVVDNERVASGFNQALEIDTAQLSDGWHDLRVLGFDTSNVASVGVWQRELIVNNRGRSASVEAASTRGDLSTTFSFDVSSVAGSFGSPVEIRLVQHGRVLDAAAGCEATLEATGLQLGAGTSDVQAEALFADGSRVRSAPLQVVVDYVDGTPSGSVAGVSESVVWVGDAAEMLVSLPTRHDDRAETPVFEIVTAPAQATVLAGPDGPYRLIEPGAGASGFDELVYRVTTSAGQSELGRVVLVYDRHPLDVNGDGAFDVDDAYAIHASPADVNLDGVADAEDRRHLERVLRCGELRDMGAR